MNAIVGSRSKFSLKELALLSAIQLERARSGIEYDPNILTNFAKSLLAMSDPHVADASFLFVEPGYYEPFERLCRERESTNSVAVKDIQAHMKRMSARLERVAGGTPAEVSDLIDFCVTLHQQLIQELSSEDALVVHGWRSIGDNATAGLGTP